jgi:hypothetical protein
MKLTKLILNMKKHLLLTLICCSQLFFFAVAQQPNGNQRMEALKVAYITKNLALTPDEAQKFWPIYNAYSDEIKKARIDSKDDELKFEEVALNIRKKYKPDFAKVLVDEKRVNQVFVIDKSFNGMLQKALKERQQTRQNRPRF